jgi:hypothetical protein
VREVYFSNTKMELINVSFSNSRNYYTMDLFMSQSCKRIYVFSHWLNRKRVMLSVSERDDIYAFFPTPGQTGFYGILRDYPKKFGTGQTGFGTIQKFSGRDKRDSGHDKVCPAGL